MEIDLVRFTSEVTDFLNVDTLRAIDYGVLDLHHVGNFELRQVYYFLEELLTVELEVNYLENGTGIFRVARGDGFWYYKEGRHVIRADCLGELEEKVLCENRIWYVFDEELASRI